MYDGNTQVSGPDCSGMEPARARAERSDAEGVPCATMFATETMAELSARQGRVSDAVAIYRHLVLAAETALTPSRDAGSAQRIARWRARLAELEGGAAANGKATLATTPSPLAPTAVPSGDAPAPSVSAATVRHEARAVPALAAGSRAAGAATSPRPMMPGLATSRCQTALVIREPVRAGQVVYAEGRDLIVLAPVHAGAQLLADGHIHVYGALRGRAVAGAKGARHAQVFCLALEAQLVGVDTGYMLSDDIPSAAWGRAVRVYLNSEGICLVSVLTADKSPSASLRLGRRGR